MALDMLEKLCVLNSTQTFNLHQPKMNARELSSALSITNPIRPLAHLHCHSTSLVSPIRYPANCLRFNCSSRGLWSHQGSAMHPELMYIELVFSLLNFGSP